jgi:HlyD family secretion protein
MHTLRHRLITCALGSLCALSLGACSPTPPTSYAGYVEGEYVYLSVPVSGYLSQLDLKRGARVHANTAIFSVDAKLDETSLQQAMAQSQAAQERASNLNARRRTPEIQSAQASLRAAQSALDLANSHLQRTQSLATQHFVSELALDDARAQQRQAQAQWEAAQAALKLANEPIGRNAERSAAVSDVKAAQSLAEQRTWLVEHSTARSNSDGELVDVYFRVGEWVNAYKPVAAVLPDQGRLIRFFVPQAVLPHIQPGSTVRVQCDGCREEIRATVEVIYPNAEFSPPVIFSKERREKLLFRIDARPQSGGTMLLPPGLPVSVFLP